MLYKHHTPYTILHLVPYTIHYAHHALYSRLKRDIYSHLPPKQRYVVQVKVEDETLRQQLGGMVKRVLAMQEKRGQNKKKRGKKVVKGYVEEDKKGGCDASKEGDMGRKLDISDGYGNEDGDDGDIPTPQEEKHLLMQLFQRSGLAKLPSILTHLGDFLQHRHTGKVLVFAHHIDVLKGIEKFVKEKEVKYIYIGEFS